VKSSPDAYFRTRFTEDRHRSDVWRHLNAYFGRFIETGDTVVELGAGYCHFINGVTAARRIAVDHSPDLGKYTAEGVETFSGDVLEFLRTSGDESSDVVMASNFLEHFDWNDLEAIIAGIRRILRPGGTLLLLQPNFRIAPHRYFDDFTHRTIFTDVSLRDWITASGFSVTRVEPRFLPLSMKSRGARLSFLVPLYLRSPLRPFAGQMLLVAKKLRAGESI
jgi:SAM-dependent methyltransferase